MKFLELAHVATHYSKDADVLELEFGHGIKRTATIAYEDLVLIHLGTKPERSDERVLQGMTFIGFQRIREKMHGLMAGQPEVNSAALAEFLRNVELDIQEEGHLAVLKDNRYWNQTPIRLRQRIGPHVEIIQDPLGKPIGIAINNANGLDTAAVTEFLDLMFAAILPTDEEKKDPMRLALSRTLAICWMGPLVTAA